MALTTVKNAGLAGSIDLATKVTGTLPTSNYTSGISQYQQWRLTVNTLNTNQDNAFITSDLEIVDTNAPQTLGSNMTQSSGVFTFPSTGVYQITYTGNAYNSDNSDDRGVNFSIYTTTDNSNYSIASTVKQVMLWTPNSNASYCTASIYAVFDVTDTSTHKCKFGWGTSQGTTIWLRGSTSESQTSFQFMKLGDT